MFKITPVETYNAAYPRRRANTAATFRRISRWRWLLTVVLGVFLALFSSACGDGNNDDDIVDGDSDTIDRDSAEYIDNDFWTDGIPDYTDADIDDYDDFDNTTIGIEAPMEYDTDPDMDTGEDALDQWDDTWDQTIGEEAPFEFDTDDEPLTEDIDTWEQPDKPGPDGDDDTLTEEETEDEYEGLTGLVNPAACAKPR